MLGVYRERERDDAGARHSALVRRRTCVTAPLSPRFHRVPRCSRHPRVLRWLLQLSSLSVLGFLLKVHLIFPFAPCIPSVCARILDGCVSYVPYFFHVPTCQVVQPLQQSR
jgi:hypothetical protein